MRWVLMEYQIHHKYNTKIVTINTVQTFFQDHYISSESAISRGLRHFVSYHDVHGWIHQPFLTNLYFDFSTLLVIFCHYFMFKSNNKSLYCRYPVKQILLSWETFLIMAISTERWIAIRMPLWHRTHSLRCVLVLNGKNVKFQNVYLSVSRCGRVS